MWCDVFEAAFHTNCRDHSRDGHMAACGNVINNKLNMT